MVRFIVTRHQLRAKVPGSVAWRATESSACGRGNAVALTSTLDRGQLLVIIYTFTGRRCGFGHYSVCRLLLLNNGYRLSSFHRTDYRLYYNNACTRFQFIKYGSRIYNINEQVLPKVISEERVALAQLRNKVPVG